MTDNRAAPLVRPGFLKASVVAFVLLLPFLAHAIWDYVETRDLKQRIDAIAARGEPTRVRQYADPKGDARAAQRYYRAAAALASDLGEESALLPAFFKASQTRSWSADLIASMRAEVNEHADVLQYADRASVLPFAGFIGSYSYLTSDLINVGRLCSFRALVRAADGDGQSAVDSLNAQMRVARATGGATYWREIPFEGLQFVLTHARPDKSALARLSAAAQELDSGNELRTVFLQIRAEAIDSPEINPLSGRRSSNWADAIPRPWMAHQLNASLETLDALIAAADGAWPDQMDKVRAVAPNALVLRNQPARWPQLVEFDIQASAGHAAKISVVRAVLGIEMYRRDHAEQIPPSIDALVPEYLSATPSDPYTGHPLVMKADVSGYAVYSVGANGRDDGGDFAPRQVAGRTSYEPEGPDVGIRVSNSR